MSRLSDWQDEKLARAQHNAAAILAWVNARMEVGAPDFYDVLDENDWCGGLADDGAWFDDPASDYIHDPWKGQPER